MTETCIRVSGFAKRFRVGLRRKLAQAVHDVSLEVHRGEIFGFLGPNGAGKTTTIKALLGLIRPDRGELSILGHPAQSMGWRAYVGYLPEHPNFYEFLTGFELVVWLGKLSGLSQQEAEKEAKRQLERVQMSHAMNRRLRSYSKGMLQRVGLAQALIGSPKVLILDEPMTGLDPIGRRDIRELILELKHEGRTILYSSHILPDVEQTCDRVAIIHQGRLRQSGPLEEILRDTTRSVTVRLAELQQPEHDRLRTAHPDAKHGPGWIEIEFPDAEQAQTFAREHIGNARVEAIEPHRDNLEAIFMKTLGPIQHESMR